MFSFELIAQESKMERQQNVLQYEFFHVGGKSVSSLGYELAECAERAMDNLPLAVAGNDISSGIKIIVRIYDIDGRVTRLTRQVEELKAQQEVHINAPRSNLFTNWYARWQIRRLQKRVDRAKKLMVEYYSAYVSTFLYTDGMNVAREIGENIFRPAEMGEYIELLLGGNTAKDFRLFIFEPDDLLANRTNVVVSMM